MVLWIDCYCFFFFDFEEFGIKVVDVIEVCVLFVVGVFGYVGFGVVVFVDVLVVGGDFGD